MYRGSRALKALFQALFQALFHAIFRPYFSSKYHGSTIEKPTFPDRISTRHTPSLINRYMNHDPCQTDQCDYKCIKAVIYTIHCFLMD